MQSIKGVQSIIVVAVIEGCHYNGGAIPLQQLNELRICHAFKLTGRKVPDASESLWFVFMPNEYLQNRGCKPQWRLSKGGGGKSFYGELKGGRDILCFGHCLPDAMAFHGVLSLLNFQILWHPSQKETHYCFDKSTQSFVFQAHPLDFMSLICGPVVE